MKISCRNVLRSVTVVVCLLPASFAFGTEKLELTHTVYLGGLYVGNVKTGIVQTEDSYLIESKAETNSTWSWLLKWVAEGRSQGSISRANVSPESHVHQSAWNDKKRGAVIEYSLLGKVTYEVVGKPQDNLSKYTPLDPETVHKSMDPMSMILGVAEKLQNGEACAGTYSVFDGWRRYDVVLSAVSEKLFGPSDYSVFEGAAIGCKIKIDKKGGFKRNSDYELPQESDVILWAGSPVEGGRIVPVRMQVTTSFGSMEMHLAGYSQGETKLASKKAQ